MSEKRVLLKNCGNTRIIFKGMLKIIFSLSPVEEPGLRTIKKKLLTG
jgi:hypothetical protein